MFSFSSCILHSNVSNSTTSLSVPLPLELLNNAAKLGSDWISRPFSSPQNQDHSAFSRLILCRSRAVDLVCFWSSSSRHGGPRCVMAAGGELGQQGRGDTPRVCSAIVVVAMVAIVVVAREMAVACLTCPPRAVTSVIDARRCLALWECRREGGEENG